MPCSEYGMNVTNCNTTELSWLIIPGGENQSSCIPRRYTGSLCLSLLQSWQGCAVGGTQDVLVDVSGDIEELDRTILMTSNAFGTLSYLSSMPLKLCHRSAFVPRSRVITFVPVHISIMQLL